MGYMRHNAIVVTSWADIIEVAHAEARRIFSQDADDMVTNTSADVYVTNITEGGMNGYRSFLVAPDGSKEGWTTSEWADARRDEFVAYLVGTRYEDGSGSLGWVEVQFDDDDRETQVVRDSDNYFPESAGAYE